MAATYPILNADCCPTVARQYGIKVIKMVILELIAFSPSIFPLGIMAKPDRICKP